MTERANTPVRGRSAADEMLAQSHRHGTTSSSLPQPRPRTRMHLALRVRRRTLQRYSLRRDLHPGDEAVDDLLKDGAVVLQDQCRHGWRTMTYVIDPTLAKGGGV